jgi:CRISPR system Cascade subunit CasC
MLIEIHVIQNHSPANLNRDDLGAPKTCYFGGVMRSRISSQCLKRSIRTSKQFECLLGGVATRRLAQLIAGNADSPDFERAMGILKICGIAPKEKKGRDKDDPKDEDKSAGRVYTSRQAIDKMGALLRGGGQKSDPTLAQEFARIIAAHTAVPDMALCGRMLEPKKPAKAKGGSPADAGGAEDNNDGGNGKGVWKGLDLTVEAALQVAHAISTHEARPEVDYFVAADDVLGQDAGAGFVGEAMFASACFYKYFSIHWETLLKNLAGFQGNKEYLAAHTVGAFLGGMALTNPTGKQNSFAAHNLPDGILVVKTDGDTPVSYANAFASPVPSPRDPRPDGPRDLVAQSIAQLGQYVHDLDTGYGKAGTRFWFSPNLRYPLTYSEDNKEQSCVEMDRNVKSFDALVAQVVQAIGFDWKQVRTVTVR